MAEAVCHFTSQASTLPASPIHLFPSCRVQGIKAAFGKCFTEFGTASPVSTETSRRDKTPQNVRCCLRVHFKTIALLCPQNILKVGTLADTILEFKF